MVVVEVITITNEEKVKQILETHVSDRWDRQEIFRKLNAEGLLNV